MGDRSTARERLPINACEAFSNKKYEADNQVQTLGGTKER